MLSKCFFRCLHDEISSFLEFNVAISGWRIIKSFSYKHRLHLFVLLEYALQRLIIFHFSEKFALVSFKFQIYLLSAVLCLRLGFLKVLV